MSVAVLALVVDVSKHVVLYGPHDLFGLRLQCGEIGIEQVALGAGVVPDALQDGEHGFVEGAASRFILEGDEQMKQVPAGPAAGVRQIPIDNPGELT